MTLKVRKLTKEFKPLLAVDATEHLDNVKFPKLASTKFDGIRCVFHPEKGMISRSFKKIQNLQLQFKFEQMQEHAEMTNIIFDGELYSHDLNFQEIMRTCMTQDFWTTKGSRRIMEEKGFTDFLDYKKYVSKLIDSISFYCFDCVGMLSDSHKAPFVNRQMTIKDIDLPFVIPVEQWEVHSADEVRDAFKKALDKGFEGLILRDPNGPYKFGRSTLKEEYLLKCKPFESFDGQVIEVIQATEVDPNAEKTVNELGRSVTSKKKDDRIPIEKASAFKVRYIEDVTDLQGVPQEQYGHELKVSLAMTDVEKEEVWKNRDSYIGKWIEYKGMVVGAKDVPRHAVMLRFREAKE